MNSFGRIFRVSIFGESHGKGAGIVIDGCPPGIKVTDEDFEKDLARRRSGADGTTPRKESDLPEVVSGFFNGMTTGAPITILFRNSDTRSSDYSGFRSMPRPGHADFTSQLKYKGYNDMRGSGHFSGRITVGLVAAGVIAKKIISRVDITASLVEAGGSKEIKKAVSDAASDNDSVGGIIECRLHNMAQGLGEPFFDSFESVLSHIIFAVPGVRGLEFGSGFRAASMRGSEHNDNFTSLDGKTETNNHAGINGGITNGNEIFFRVAMKPTSSIARPQHTFNMDKKEMGELKAEGRHDTCFALRVPPVIEAVSAIAAADLFLIDRLYQNK
ncbi:MAG: chorismate synthase [Spirochaetia bacterium]|jgi:chorismate synthase|nr:chorismate synthase [Spirochaetia bacterium]